MVSNASKMFVFFFWGFCINLFIHPTFANPFDGLKNAMETLKNTLKETEELLKETEKYVNTEEVKEVKKFLFRNVRILEDKFDENDLILKYETACNKLNEFVINKTKEIDDVEEMINAISGLTDGSQFSTIMSKKKENTNQIIDCNNQIVERIRELETTIYNNRMKELDNMKIQRYGELKQVEVQQPIITNDKEMDIINNSMGVLKQWSNKNTSNILFDSKVDGDGSNNVLHDRVFNRSNLYFITFDGNNNVFGGYVSENINKSNDHIKDENAFIFSLIRDKKLKNTNYPIISNYSSKAFYLFNNDQTGWLYQFGGDIYVKRIGDNKSWCRCYDYEYNKEKKPLIDTSHSNKFQAKRIIVIEMN